MKVARTISVPKSNMKALVLMAFIGGNLAVLLAFYILFLS